ncbi:ABC-type transport system involved in multi-copper enzyme maturation permease subunit [Enterococcus sp. PF1-24]|uniref:ABC transporter permease n=1 Tax=unclassified Enterococcus TaxID=2608891 RepID=UPI002475490C|nr:MULTISPECIES: ABC transporter permease [unclassified Enterococcus]MDH6363903.1 ABC-type transport system involved in multi-copper enzyme maturation permease subunit [Enterococcus sp. PFB1-1]MDH6400911.1 ABC-type transport system involved in multi-copper enzyme maturation permease subunit [Enterococcus sp. PF1-24]
MLAMIRADIYRIIKGQQGVISSIILLVLAVGLAWLGKDAGGEVASEQALVIGSLFIPIFLTVVLTVIWGQEINNRTINNTLIAGASRLKFFISKWLLICIWTIVEIAIFVVGFNLASLILGNGLLFNQLLPVIALQLPFYFAISALLLLLLNLFPTNTMAVLAFVTLLFMGDNLLQLLLQVLAEPLSFISEYFIFTNLNTMIHFAELTQAKIIAYITVALLGGVVCLISSGLIFRKKALK